MSDFYDYDGEPIDLMTWSRMFERGEERQIACDTVNGYLLSTVWLGLDHGYGMGPPLIFETMLFAPDGTSHDCWRYSTREQALAGHAGELATLKLLESAAK